MPNTNPVSVKTLLLDLFNFRTMPQVDEPHAVQAMYAIGDEWFLALMESLLDDGYLPTENIIVLKTNTSQPKLIVKEGNRRVAALKIICGYLPVDTIVLPDKFANRINELSAEWKTANESVPCTIFEEKDAATVDKIVALAHGKGEKAGKDKWNAVARARHSRDVIGSNEPPLDLLEKYLKEGKNLTEQEKELWGGVYPLTVLEDAMKRISIRFKGISNSAELAKKYPSIDYRNALESILRAIGLEELDFKKIRDKDQDFAAQYGLPTVTSSSASASAASQGGSKGSTTGASGGSSSQSQGTQAQGTSSSGAGSNTSKKKMVAVAINDPKAVRRMLRAFKPLGANREKIVSLKDEALKLNIEKTPLAFCFILRSMFEISAKVYCDDHKASSGPSATKSDGTDKSLVDMLRDITKYMTTMPNQKPDQAMQKALHGAMTELAKKDGILSVASLNQLIHNPKFSIQANDISIVFGNIYPLLEAMNR